MKLLIWVLTLVGLTPALLLSSVSCAMAILSRITLSDRPGSVTHFIVGNLFFELGAMKITVKPAVLPALLVWIGAILLVYGLKALAVTQQITE